MEITLHNQEELERFTREHPIALVWFSGAECNVCHALRPKVEMMLAEEFPEAPMAYVECGDARELAAQHAVFAIPTLAVWIDGREGSRFQRSFGLGEIRQALARPYAIFFDE